MQNLIHNIAATLALNYNRSQNSHAILMRRVDPRQRRYCYVFVAEIAEVIDARPMVETVVIPFFRSVDETKKKQE